jgi:hypothetical protein
LVFSWRSHLIASSISMAPPFPKNHIAGLTPNAEIERLISRRDFALVFRQRRTVVSDAREHLRSTTLTLGGIEGPRAKRGRRMRAWKQAQPTSK